ncbi:uncharacterized protein LOC124089268 [Marmota monax]|uniref:uncharacterized protein LOC124089268 n=1 Tax=Marmota monax TaxID=9995 RepID=UPI0026F1CB69|nr:uncharacterized protein LOC124089268 [Marmota monax]
MLCTAAVAQDCRPGLDLGEVSCTRANKGASNPELLVLTTSLHQGQAAQDSKAAGLGTGLSNLAWLWFGRQTLHQRPAGSPGHVWLLPSPGQLQGSEWTPSSGPALGTTGPVCSGGLWPAWTWKQPLKGPWRSCKVLWLPGSHCRPVPGLCSAADVERSLGQADSGWDQEAPCPPTEGDKLHRPLLSDWASLAARLPGPVAAAQGGPASVDSRCPEPWGGLHCPGVYMRWPPVPSPNPGHKSCSCSMPSLGALGALRVKGRRLLLSTLRAAPRPAAMFRSQVGSGGGPGTRGSTLREGGPRRGRLGVLGVSLGFKGSPLQPFSGRCVETPILFRGSLRYKALG